MVAGLAGSAVTSGSAVEDAASAAPPAAVTKPPETVVKQRRMPSRRAFEFLGCRRAPGGDGGALAGGPPSQGGLGRSPTRRRHRFFLAFFIFTIATLLGPVEA